MKTFSVPFEKRSHGLEALIKVKLILDVNFFTFVDERVNNDIFAEADVIFLILLGMYFMFPSVLLKLLTKR